MESMPAKMRSTGTFLMVLSIISLILTTIPSANGSEVVVYRRENLIGGITFKIDYFQYEELKIEIGLNESIEFDNMSFGTNIESWIGDIPSIRDQIPFSDLPFQVEMGNGSTGKITIRADLSDQNIFFDGRNMLDTVSLTFAFICRYNMTEEMETITIPVTNVNDPPVMNGSILMDRETIETGDEVRFSIENATDPDMDYLEFLWKVGGRSAGNGKSISWTFKDPGTYSVEVEASDGELSDTRVITVKVSEKEVITEPVRNETEPSTSGEEENDANLPWIIVPVLILLIVIVLILGFIRSILLAEDLPEKKAKVRKIWSMSPLRGPSGYERNTLQARLDYIGSPNHKDLDDERVLEEDYLRWEKDWDFDPGI